MRWLSSCLLALGSLCALADDAPAKRPAKVTAECLIVSLPEKAALTLLPALKEDDKIEAACATLWQMIDRKEVALVANLVLNGIAGEEQKAESLTEYKYPTEFDPPHFPDALPPGREEEVVKNWPLFGLTATAFETRHLGSSLTLLPHVSADGRWIEASVTVLQVRLMGMLKYDCGKRRDGEHLWVEQPEFGTAKSVAKVELSSGQRLLFGVHKIAGPEKTLELFLLRLTTRP